MRSIARLWLRRGHRWCGVFAGIGVLWLTVTGSALFTVDRLGLSRKPLPPSIISQFYGLQVEGTVTRRTTDGHQLTGTAGQWAFDGKPIADAPGMPLGLVRGGQLRFAIGSRGLVMVSDAGALIEQIDASTLGLADVTAYGMPDATSRLADGLPLCLRDSRGVVRCTRDALDWRAPGADAAPVRWHEPEVDNQAPLPTWERLIQDLHGLRFLGPAAVPVGLIFGIALMVLVISGMYTALMPRRHTRH